MVSILMYSLSVNLNLLFFSWCWLVRHGWKGDATLDVTLLNTPDGFKYDEYGQSITIRRTIKQPSGGGFELISHDGEV